MIDSAFGNRLLTYRINPQSSQDFITPESFLEEIKQTLITLISKSLNELTTIKANFILHANFIHEVKKEYNSFDFQTWNYMFCIGDRIESIYETICQEIYNKIDQFQKKGSGWSLDKIKYIDININKFNPLRGSSYIDLPIDIKNKKAIINVKNTDHQCFMWAILSALYPTSKNCDRKQSYIKHKNKLNFNNIPFPVKLRDINKFEIQNNISVNVFGLEYHKISKSNTIVGPLYFTKNRKRNHINLLYIMNGTNGHYCYIRSMSRLIKNQISSRTSSIYICDGCLLHFTSMKLLSMHQTYDCVHVRTDLPDGKKTRRDWFGQLIANDRLSFQNYNNQLKVPFVVYADFEAFLNPISVCHNDPKNPYTLNVQKHEVYSFGYYIKCSYNDSFSKYKSYTGKNCALVFMQSLKQDLEFLIKKINFRSTPISLSHDEKLDIQQSDSCYICKKCLRGESFIVYDWHTGQYRGVAHNQCARSYCTPNFIPVFLHNLSNYDSHFIVHALNFDSGEIDIIPQNKERYVSFSKRLRISNREISLRFLDSFRFMSCSLENLANNLESHQFHELRRMFPKDDDFSLLIRKGIYPYEYMTSYDCLKLTFLPNQNEFYSSLTDSGVSNENYQHAKNVWNHFCCQSMGDYSDLYQKTDVLLLTDVFENFRNLCLDTYGLDPAHYYTSPGLNWDPMLKYTQIELELLSDFDKIAFIKKGIRGGVSQCSNRYAKANNKYMAEYNSQTPPSYLIYLDANNLYGWAMSQYLPIGEFEWVDTNTNFRVEDDADYGFILEVDLEYPTKVHDSHSDLPFCPENIYTGDSKYPKLVANLNNKIKYIIHYRNLKQCLENGLILTKIHRILKFKQTAWLKKYIDLNTEMRTKSRTEFEKDFYKLMNNSVFGKTMENIEKRVNVKLLTHWGNVGKIQGVESLIARPEFHSLSIFSENLVAVQLKKTKLLYNKPIYIGFCVLDISKTLMYRFHYGYMKNKFENSLKLMYTDTDSFIYQIFIDDFYASIKYDLKTYFDTSNYVTDNQYDFPLLNKKKLGYFKDENNGQIFKEFVGLRSKMYAMDVQDRITAKAKGVNKSVTKNLTIESYRNCLLDNTIKYSEMLRFKSIKHLIYTQRLNKISLSSNDTKRYLIPDSTDTIAWGHYKLNKL